MALKKFLDPKNEIVFRKLFCSPTYKEVVIHFLNDILDFSDDKKIKSLSVLSDVDKHDQKDPGYHYVKLSCTNQSNQHYIINMQVAHSKEFAKKAQYYAAKTYFQQLDETTFSANLIKTISLAFTNFMLFPHKPSYRSVHHIIDAESGSHDLTDFHFHFIELPKFKRDISELETITDRWIYFFKHAQETNEDQFDLIAGSNIALRQAYAATDSCYWTKEELDKYEIQQKEHGDYEFIVDGVLSDDYILGEIKGRSKGHSEGLEQMRSQLATVKVMRSQGNSFEGIQRSLNLSEDDIAFYKEFIL